MQKEIDKAEISIVDTGENPDAPHPREMIDLEVCAFVIIYLMWRWEKLKKKEKLISIIHIYLGEVILNFKSWNHCYF